jgi:hypothetical protein
MSRDTPIWDRMAAKTPRDNPPLCQSIQSQALGILAGEPISKDWQEHRESCLACIKVLRDAQRKLKAELPAKPKGIFAIDDLGYAAGSTHSWRTLQAGQIRNAGLSSGWHLDIRESDSQTYRLAVVCDVPKNIRIKLLDAEQNIIHQLDLCQVPEYLDRALAERCQSLGIEEL